MPGFDEVFAQMPSAHELEDAVMDQGYDSNHIRETFKAYDINRVIPPKSNRLEFIRV
jgi:hypothetical protein